MIRWCDDCKYKDTCEIYKEEMQSPRASFFQGCLGGYEQEDKKNLPSCNSCLHNGTWDCIKCKAFDLYERGGTK